MNSLFLRMLQEMANHDASDLFLIAGAPPSIKVHGQLHHLGNEPLTVSVLTDILDSALPKQAKQRYEDHREANFALSPPGLLDSAPTPINSVMRPA